MQRKTHLFQIHGLHRRIHALDYTGHAARHLPHGDGRLHPAADGIDSAGQAEEVEPFVLLADGVLGVDFGDVAVVLLDGLWGGVMSIDFKCRSGYDYDGAVWKEWGVCTFFSFPLSVCSSLPALAAWRLSCFAVN